MVHVICHQTLRDLLLMLVWFLNQNYVPGIHGTYVAKRFLRMYVNTFTSIFS